MTKYKLNNTVRSASEVTLTSYMTGSTDSGSKPAGELDTNQNDHAGAESNRNLAPRRCPACPHGCDFLRESETLAASLAKQECDKFGLNELRVDGLDKNVCLCEKYNGGCKLCPRPRLPALTYTLAGKEACLACHRSACAEPYSSK